MFEGELDKRIDMHLAAAKAMQLCPGTNINAKHKFHLCTELEITAWVIIFWNISYQLFGLVDQLKQAGLREGRGQQLGRGDETTAAKHLVLFVFVQKKWVGTLCRTRMRLERTELVLDELVEKVCRPTTLRALCACVHSGVPPGGMGCIRAVSESRSPMRSISRRARLW